MIPKFRVWNKALNQMGKVATMEYDSYGLEVHYWAGGDYYIDDIDDITLMQSTGLLDKNGVEIFDGDIVQWSDTIYTVFYDNTEAAYRLRPCDERWSVDYISNYTNGNSLEVIGNIHENPELVN